MESVNFLSANLYSHGKMKLNCVKACKNLVGKRMKLRWEEKCVLISYNVCFCE